MAERSIYVLLSDTGTLFTTLIKSFTAAPYNHASLALDAGLNDMFSFGRKCPMRPWAAGFVEEDVREGMFRQFPDTRCVLLRLRITREQYAAVLRVIRTFQREREAYRYNMIGLLGVLLNRDIGPKKAYFCSQFVADVLRRASLPLWNRPSGLVTPNDFLLHPAFEQVYEGYLYDYELLGTERFRYEQSAADLSIPLRGRAF